MNLLKFRIGNAKLRGRRVVDGEDKGLIYTFTLPSGYTCPGAKLCRSRFDRELNRIVDGKETVYRCFAASGESRPNVRALADYNFELLKGLSQQRMETLISMSIPEEARIIRVHVGGDFFSEEYFRAWMFVAEMLPDIRFYAYTKSINFWVKNRSLVPENFRLTASYGGKFDSLIAEHGLKTTKVVFGIEEAAALGLEIDHDDSHAYQGTRSFTLLIHGTQPAGSDAGKAVRALQGVGSYGRGRA